MFPGNSDAGAMAAAVAAAAMADLAAASAVAAMAAMADLGYRGYGYGGFGFGLGFWLRPLLLPGDITAGLLPYPYPGHVWCERRRW